MIRWFTRHPTAANLLLLLFIAAGALALPTLNRQTFPDFHPIEAEILVAWRGAAAEDVETAICHPLWDAVRGVEGLQEFSCRAQANRARAVARLGAGGDALRFIADLRTEVAAISGFPATAEAAVVRALHRTSAVASVAVHGAVPVREMDRYAAALGDRLAALPGVARVIPSGLGQRTFRIEASRTLLEGHGLTPAGLAAVLGAQSLDLPAGSLDTPGAEFTLRLTEERRDPSALAALPVLSLQNGATLTVGDVATIREVFTPAEERTRLDGRAAMLLEVHRSHVTDALRTLDAMTALVEQEAALLPPGLHVEVVQDMTSIVRDRLSMLVHNGAMGFLLVVAAMSLFFRPSFALWVAMGLPVAFLGAFAWMALTGLTLNMMTLVALLMATGIVMDDSIVLAEAIAVEAAEDASADAVVRGAMAVAPGVVSSFLTTAAIFLPLSFLAGELGAVLQVLPVVLLAALAASLIEAFLILPRHLKSSLVPVRGQLPGWRQSFEARFVWLRDNGVGRVADAAIAWRYAVAGIAIGLSLLTIGALAGGLVKREALPSIEADVLEARILMPAGTPLHRTEAAAAQVEAALARVDARLRPEQPDGRSLVLRSITRMGRNLSAGENGPHLATVSADLLGAGLRRTSINALRVAWREEIGPLPGVASLVLTEPGRGPQGMALELRVFHPDLDVLDRAARAILAELQSYAGVRNAMLDLRPGQPELRLQLARGARALGLTAADVASQIRAGFLGAGLADVRSGRIAHEVELRLAEADRDELADLELFPLSLPDGGTVPLGSVVDLREARGWSSIRQIDGVRVATVEADVDPRQGNAARITAALRAGFLPDLEAATPGLRLMVAGQAANSAETMASILRGFLVGLVGIYVVLSFQLRSYTEPLIVMVSIPLAYLGVVWGHVAMGYDISLPSMVGAASLAGIVVNNAILLAMLIRARTAEGLDIGPAAGAAVRERFRPILLSVSTTILGMAPLLAETSTQAQTLKPLVIAVVFGLLASTVLVLVVLPSIYAIANDIRLRRTATPRGRKRQSR